MKTAFELAQRFAPPAKDDTALTTLLTKLIDVSLNRPEPKHDDTATKALLSFLEKQNDRLAAEIKELRNAPAAQPNNVLTQVKELRPVITEFVEIFAAKNGGDQPWWAGPLEKLMDGVGDAIPGIVDLVKTGQQQQRQQQQPNTWPNPGLPAPQAQTAQPPPQGPPPSTATATAPQPEQQPQMTDQQQREMKWGPFILFISPQMVEEFKKDEDGHGGYYFRDWLLEMHGRLRWSDLRRDIGPALLSAMIAQHPALSVEISPEQERNIFVQDFFTVPGEEPGEADSAEQPAIDLGGEDAA